MPKANITPAFVKNLSTLPGKARTEWICENFPGLYLEARSTSTKGTWYLRYRNHAGQTKHLRLGDTENLSVSEAKSLAKEKRAEIQLHGADPSGEAQKQREAISFSEFFESIYLPYIKAKKRSYKDDENRARLHLIPNYGHLKLNKISRRQISDLHLQLKQSGLKGATCDHYLKILKSMFNYAIRLELISVSPASGVPLYREPNQLEHYLNDEQLKRLLTVLKTNSNRTPCHVALFLLSSGARLNEALTSTWESICMEDRTWKVSANNSKNKKSRYIMLNESAIDILNEIQPDKNLRQGFVFLNAKTGERLRTVHGAWGRLRSEAGLPFLRLHDLRHLYASFLINAGRTLYEVQNALGHSSPVISQRYSHLQSDVLLSASGAASDRIRAASPPPAPVDVIQAS